MKSLSDIRAAKTVELVAYYNANSGKSPITKFSERKIAEARCIDLFETLAEKQPKAAPSVKSQMMSIADTVAFAKAIQDKKNEPKPAKVAVVDHGPSNARIAACLAEEVKPIADTSSISDFDVHGQTHCPSCGIHLSNGICGHEGEVNGKRVVFTKNHEYWCMACEAEFGPAIHHHVKSELRAAGIKASWQDPDTLLARSTRNRVTVGGTEYRSVAAAFVALGLPLSKHIAFRKELKAATKATFDQHQFSILED